MGIATPPFVHEVTSIRNSLVIPSYERKDNIKVNL
jgi:hypothetical protein